MCMPHAHGLRPSTEGRHCQSKRTLHPYKWQTCSGGGGQFSCCSSPRPRAATMTTVSLALGGDDHVPGLFWHFPRTILPTAPGGQALSLFTLDR